MLKFIIIASLLVSATSIAQPSLVSIEARKKFFTMKKSPDSTRNNYAKYNTYVSFQDLQIVELVYDAEDVCFRAFEELDISRSKKPQFMCFDRPSFPLQETLFDSTDLPPFKDSIEAQEGGSIGTGNLGIKE